MIRITHGLPKNTNAEIICDAAYGVEVSCRDNTGSEETIFLDAVVQFSG